MDIEFVQLEHRDDITNLMEVCGMDLPAAYELYHHHRCNLQAAVSQALGLASPLREDPPVQHDIVEQDQLGMSFDEDSDPEFHRYCRFLEGGLPFFKKYPIRNEIDLEKKDNQHELTQNLSFKQDMESLLGERVNWKIEAGRVEDGLRWSWKDHFPIAVLVLSFEGECGQALKTNLANEALGREICTYFKVYGVDPNSSRIEAWLTPFLKLPEDINRLVVLRVSYMDEIQTIARINLGEGSPQALGKQAQRVKSQCINREYDEAHIIKQHALRRRGMTSYHRPPSIKESIKLREDAKLRRQQDEEFMKACLPRKERPDNSEGSGDVTRTVSKAEAKQSAEELKAMREQKRQQLTMHGEGLRFKLRLPSGKGEQLCVRGDEPVQYFFDFVWSHPEEAGFERDHARNFDIVYGPEKNQSLLGCRQSKVEEVLEEFELLIVKELDQ